MARWLLMLVFSVVATGALTGCEFNADADHDHDGARLEVDVDD